MSAWISVTEAAEMLGYSPDYFRRAFCANPVAGICVMKIVVPGKKKPRYRLLRADVERLAINAVISR